MLSIIIPTFNEGENVIEISRRIANVLRQEEYEIIFVDDSRDNTVDLLDNLSKSNPNIRYKHRENGRGLATAVMCGFEMAKGDVLAVMDSDLQHPPELLRTMLKAVDSGADIVLPSRFIPGGSDGGLNFIRKTISFTARWIGRVLLKSIRNFSDVTGGYFMFRKEVIDGAELNPVGWKILMEILVRGKYSKVVEVPYSFNERFEGTSKMSLMEQWNYLRHIMRLLKDSAEDRRFLLFSIVGLSGVLVNMAIYAVLVKLGMNVGLSAVLSALTAMLSNFYLNNKYTWSDSISDNILKTAARYIITSLAGIIINYEVLQVLYNSLHLHYMLSNLCGIAAAMLWNYFINKLWTWKTEKRSDRLQVLKWSAETQGM